MAAVTRVSNAGDDRVIPDASTPEVEWRPWLDARLSPPIDPMSPAFSATRLVVVAPHPDDEVLACGGLVVARRAVGKEVVVVAVTDGEASHPGDPAWSRDRLAAARRGESGRGLARLGVDAAAVVRLGLPDSAVALHASSLQNAVGNLLRRGDAVVTTWRFDGHPDHEATGAGCASVCAELKLALLEAPVWMWHWSTPRDERVPWHRLHRFALTPAWRQAKREAVDAHATQLAPRARGEAPVLGDAILERAERDAEYFFA